jgi:RNA polymerase sigma factor (sigma-70 family)
MSQIMSELEFVARVQLFLAKPEDVATPEEAFAWNELYRKCGRIVRGRLGGKHRGWVDDDDLFQMVWIILVHRLKTSKFDPARDTLEGWVARIVRDVLGRHNHHFAKRRDERLTPDLADELLDPEDGPDLEVSRTETRHELRELIESLRSSLSKRDHGIVAKRWLDGRSVSSIADEMGVTRDCVKAVLYRASVMLRELLRKRGLGPS